VKALVIDITRCNGCYNCQIACKDEHVANDWSPIAKPQPDTGQFWMKVKDVVRGQVPRVKVAYMLTTCQHCDEAPCLEACRSGAIYKRPDGAVIIDPEKCSGQKLCLDACPYGAIYYNEDLRIAQKCTWCAHLLDEGWKEPRCVDACPTGALAFGEEEDLEDLIARAEMLLPDAGVGARVYYIGLPKRFIAGGVCDPEEDECLEDAAVTLLGADGNEVATTKSDVFGDFWFEGLDVGAYSVKVEKTGYSSQVMSGISTEEDINIGDLELSKKA
jgi:tetrathionate reductase subunit B